MANSRLCSIPDCGKPTHRRGYCRSHYSRWNRHGDPLAGRTAIGEPMRFLEDVVMEHDYDECLIWPYSRETQGRGVIQYCGKQELVHRIVCSRVNGPMPTPKHEAAHECGKGHLGCVSPRHLSWKTRKENHADKLPHGTHQRGQRVGTSKLTESDVLRIISLKGERPVREIADEFGVSKSAIYQIFWGLRWAWLQTETVNRTSETT